ncbi:MAG: SRPBCC family protein [Gemmatimonadota bacterium]
MKPLHFSVDIDAPRKDVWQVLWNDDTYREWTSVFAPRSHAISDWKEGSRIQFLDGEGHGLDSVIEKLVPNEFMSFKHLAEIHDGEVQPLDERTSQSSGGLENYTLTERDGVTTVTVDLEAPEEYVDMFSEMFPPALQRLKEITERPQ